MEGVAIRSDGIRSSGAGEDIGPNGRGTGWETDEGEEEEDEEDGEVDRTEELEEEDELDSMAFNSPKWCIGIGAGLPEALLVTALFVMANRPVWVCGVGRVVRMELVLGLAMGGRSGAPEVAVGGDGLTVP